jgi:hypothetical protein
MLTWPEAPWRSTVQICIIEAMPLADVFPRRRGLAAWIPERLDELRGPARGIVVLPVHLTWFGLREFDVSEAGSRLRLYTIVLSQGRRSDIARFLHPGLLRQDWPQLRGLVSRQVRDTCARRLRLPSSGGPDA